VAIHSGPNGWSYREGRGWVRWSGRVGSGLPRRYAPRSDGRDGREWRDGRCLWVEPVRATLDRHGEERGDVAIHSGPGGWSCRSVCGRVLVEWKGDSGLPRCLRYLAVTVGWVGGEGTGRSFLVSRSL
jgi:hypothetical protein